MTVTEIAVPMVTGISGTIREVTLTTSLGLFGLKLFAKELKPLLRECFQIVEFTMRWWIFIRSGLTAPTPEDLSASTAE
jgi:hypothetical protein